MRERLGRPWLVLTGLALGVTVTNGFARFSYGLILPAMKSEMGWNYAQAGWLNTGNALGYIAGAVITMLLIRRTSPTFLFAFGLITTTIAHNRIRTTTIISRTLVETVMMVTMMMMIVIMMSSYHHHHHHHHRQVDRNRPAW